MYASSILLAEARSTSGVTDGLTLGSGTSSSRVAVDLARSVAEARRGSSGAADPSRGVSALKLLPGRRDVLVALKTEESGGRVASYLSILRSESGEALMPDAEVAQGFKFEGLEVSVPTYV